MFDRQFETALDAPGLVKSYPAGPLQRKSGDNDAIIFILMGAGGVQLVPGPAIFQTPPRPVVPSPVQRLPSRSKATPLVPGTPAAKGGVIVQNMPGAGSLVAANWVYGQQPDGRTIVTFHFGLITQALVGDPLVKFDPARFVWLGDPSIGGLPQVLWIRNDLSIRSLDDLRKREKPLALGVTGRAEGPAIAGEFLRYLGFPIMNISGYKGSSDIMVALERNEVDGRIIGQSTMQMIYSRYIQGGVVRPLLSLGKEPRLEPLSGVATLEDLNLNARQRNLAEFLSRTWVALRPFALPPGMPAARIAVLRRAFDQVIKDPQLIKSPLSGEDLGQIVKELSAAPRDVVEIYKTFIGLKK